ncbi:MAG: hypothetical protein Q7J58_16910 [Hydrogenophaga sp.]|jgi:hypothetical protein|uniref:hypothetical protein n=1 Tax=Hydrogenophaga sp. TaxID=1904254 RepID=UPI002718F1D3|nr:hypothetical protein [Hydrogenophaga sp.]MDO9571039.1 hypothetical protein [Hydrogenophaga sp.]
MNPLKNLQPNQQKQPMRPWIHLRRIAPMVAAMMFLTGCAATIDPSGLEQRTGQAIGRSAGQFTIGDRTEETGGRINYTVKTRDGAHYRCYLYGATGFQKAMSFGQIPHSDAVCTAMVGGQGRASPQAPAASGQAGSNGACHVLLRAAGRC